MCPSHLKDRGFCSPIIDQAAVDAKKKEDMKAEVEKVKKEYEERQRKKKEESEKSKDKDKDKDKDGDDKKKADDDKKADESKSKDEEVSIYTVPLGPGKSVVSFKKLTMLPQKAGEEPPAEEEPRVFALHRSAQLPCSHGIRRLQAVHLTQL